MAAATEAPAPSPPSAPTAPSPPSPAPLQNVLSPDPPERVPLRVRDEYFINLKEWTSVQHGGGGAQGSPEGGGEAADAAAPAASSRARPSGPAPVAKKSHRAMKRDRREERASALCYQYLQGVCVHGDTCRFSHDVSSYLSQRLPDLPGECPWARVATGCPHGITCRWAHAHRFPTAFERQWGFPAKAGNGGRHEDHEREKKEAGEEEEGAKEEPMKEEKGEKEEGAKEEPMKEERGEQEEGAKEGSVAGSADDCSKQAATTEANASPAPFLRLPPPLYRGDGSVPSSTLPVPPGRAAPLPESNALDKEVQAHLWKGTYDFSATTRILNALGFEDRQASIERVQRARGERRDQRKGVKRKMDREEGEERKDQGTEEQVGGGAEAQAQGAAGATEASDATDAKAQAAASGAAGAIAAASSDAAAVAAASSDAAEAVAAASSDAAEAIAAASSDAAAPPSSPLPARSSPPPSVPRVSPSPLPSPRSLRPFDLRGKRFLAPLTTVGNLPFRRICVGYGAEVTCGEMAVATNLLKGQAQEWALLRRHPCERLFGAQLCGAHPDAIARAAQLVEERTDVDFVDLNFGCPMSIICDRGAGSGCLLKPRKLLDVVRAAASATSLPLTLKLRKGFHDDRDVAHLIVPSLAACGARAVVIHGRSRQQRYSRRADWPYILKCAGNGGMEEKGRRDDQGAGSGGKRDDRDASRAIEVPHYPPLQNNGQRNGNGNGNGNGQGSALGGGNGSKSSQGDALGNGNGSKSSQDDAPGNPGDGNGPFGGAETPASSPAPLSYPSTFAACADRVQVIGNGDIFSWRDHEAALRGAEEEQDEEEEQGGAGSGAPGHAGGSGRGSLHLQGSVATTYVARGALIKPWIFTEIAERRDWDISASERLDMYRRYVSNGLEHWGSDARGVETTRRFLLEWLSFAHRYVPLGILERPGSQRLDQKPPVYRGRSDLETLLSSDNPTDWIAITELLLGPAPVGFQFAPKHKANAYPRRTENAGIASENATVTAHKK